MIRSDLFKEIDNLLVNYTFHHLLYDKIFQSNDNRSTSNFFYEYLSTSITKCRCIWPKWALVGSTVLCTLGTVVTPNTHWSNVHSHEIWRGKICEKCYNTHHTIYIYYVDEITIRHYFLLVKSVILLMN